VILTAKLHGSEHLSSARDVFLKRKRDVDRIAYEIFQPRVETFPPGAAECEAVVHENPYSMWGPKICGARMQHAW
jgi:hypothetical protein